MALINESRSWAALVVWLCVGLVLALFTSSSAYAAAPPPPVLDPTGRSGEPPPLTQKEFLPPTPPPAMVLPPVPPPSEAEKLFDIVRLFVREIRVTGSTVFSAEELAKVTAPFVNREITSEDLEALRRILTLYYINKGYVTSGAIIPDQTVADGVITLHVIEGELTAIEIEGNQWLRAGYIEDRLALGAGPPVNINALQERLQLLQQDERVQQINAELRPAVKRGESVLNVRVEERTPYKVWLEFNNHQSPSVGAERGLVGIAHKNLLGFGDSASFRYGRSAGINPQIDASYMFPLTARDTTVSFHYRRNDSLVVEEPFKPLDIKSKSEIYGITLRHPFYRTLNSEFALELIGEHLTSKSFLDGEPFSFSAGPNRNGESAVTALRIAQDFVHRTQNQVMSARSRFSVGLDALGATINRNGEPDGRFFAWSGQFQWARRLGILDTLLVFRSDIQLVDKPLLSLEQIAVGGRYSVRGYRENTLVRDNAFLASFESRIPLIQNARWADTLELAPFVDYGRPWRAKGTTPDPQNISSVGVGLRWAVTFSWPVPLRPQFEVYWGHPLRKIEPPQKKTLQDRGIHLQFVVAAF